MASAAQLDTGADGKDLWQVDGKPRSKPPRPARGLRLAYAIFVSPNDPHWRIYRMMKMLYNEQDFFFLHVDSLLQYHGDGDEPQHDALLAASAEAVAQVRDLLREFAANGNLRVEAIFDVSWGGVSMLNAELAMAEALMHMGEWDYVINLSSSDLPLQAHIRVRERERERELY